MWLRHRAAPGVLLLSAVTLACSGSPAAPTPDAGAGAQLTVLGDDIVTLTRGQSAALAVQEKDAQGAIVAIPADAYTWSSSAPRVVQVTGAGLITTGPELGYAVITVGSPSGLTATVHVWVQPPEGEPSPFRMTLVFGDGVPQKWRDALSDGARRWERVIRDELPEAVVRQAPACQPDEADLSLPPLGGTERGVRVYVAMSSTFTPGTYAEAVGGPCLHRPLPAPTTVYGRVRLNRDHPVDGIGAARLTYVALHELGHTLGLVALVQGRQPAWFDTRTDTYRGVLGLEGYRRAYGVRTAGLAIRGAHWPFTGDVMGAMNFRISFASVGALMDLGYPAAWYGAH